MHACVGWEEGRDMLALLEHKCKEKETSQVIV
jgi:hypothetical protein